MSYQRYIAAAPLLLLATLSLLTGCREDLLDKQVPGAFDADLFLRTEEEAIAAINAVYAPSNFSVGNDNRRWVIADVASDDVVTGGDGSQADILAIDEFDLRAENENLLRQWRLSYEAITNANVVLERLPDAGLDAALTERILGEASFLRGYHYFELALVFGGVPLVTEPRSPANLNVARASLEETYAQIYSDLAFAAERLPVSYGDADVGRATRGAALGVLAKAHLMRGEWASVLDAIDRLETLDQYRLLDSFAVLFTERGDNSAEDVWELQQATGLLMAQGNFLNQWLAPRLDNGGFGFGAVHPDLLAAFEEGDPRRNITLGYVGGIWLEDRVYPGNGLYSSTNISQKKLIQPSSETPIRAEGGLNVTILRYGDVVLMEAEAAAELGELERATVAVNRIRARARLSADSSAVDALPPIESTLSQNELIAAIRRERRVELAVEMHRFYDIRRWGIAERVLGAQGITFDPVVNNFFPIPQRELDVNDALRQNPGY